MNSPRHAGVSDLAYYEQHRAVLDALQVRRAVAPASEQDLLRRAQFFVEAWVDLDACRIARKDIQNDLVRQCHEFERRLGGQDRRSWTGKLHLPSVATTSSCAVFAVLAAYRPDQAYYLLSHTRHYMYRLSMAIEHTPYSNRLMIGTFVMFLFSWWMLNSMRRS